jgi:hypothetical protein
MQNPARYQFAQQQLYQIPATIAGDEMDSQISLLC